jgi:Protein of unknown function (DUF2752)
MLSEVGSVRRLRAIWLGVGLSIVAVALLARHYPLGGQHEIVLCLFRRITGLACPGCGLTRAFVALSRGDFTAAIAFHPLAPVLAVEAAIAWLLWGAISLGFRRRAASPWDRIALANGAALLVLWAVRIASGTLPS